MKLLKRENKEASFCFSKITSSSWPLLGYRIQDETYESAYKDNINLFIDGVFETSNMTAQYASWKTIIQSSVDGETSHYSFLNSTGDFPLQSPI